MMYMYVYVWVCLEIGITLFEAIQDFYVRTFWRDRDDKPLVLTVLTHIYFWMISRKDLAGLMSAWGSPTIKQSIVSHDNPKQQTHFCSPTKSYKSKKKQAFKCHSVIQNGNDDNQSKTIWLYSGSASNIGCDLEFLDQHRFKPCSFHRSLLITLEVLELGTSHAGGPIDDCGPSCSKNMRRGWISASAVANIGGSEHWTKHIT